MSDSLSYADFRKKKPKWSARFRRELEFQAFRGGLWLGRQLSLPQLQSLGKGLGWIAYHVMKKDRGVAELQLAKVFPEKPDAERAQWVRQCFAHFGQLLTEFFALERLMREHERYIKVENFEVLQEALEANKGALLVGLHMGNWEMFVPYAAESGHYAALVMANVPDPRMNELIRQNRQRGNIEIIPRGDGQTLRKILGCFKRNGVLFLAIDQDTNVPSIWAPFFGRLAKTPVSVARFALKTGAPVLGFTALRQPDGTFRVKLYNWGQFQPERATLQEDLYRVTRTINRHIEALILADPPQWAWFHRRWRHPASPEEAAFAARMEAELSPLATT
jgi:KDO2-lipid IV(A) lauroyltransferase